MTERCRGEDDLSKKGPQFEDLVEDDVVSQFKKKLEHTNRTSREVSGLRSGLGPVWVVQAGEKRRGCAWHDEEHEIIWLLASHPHESGSPEDSWPYFRELDAAGRLFPTEEDYDYFFEEDDARFFDALVVEADALMQRAAAAPGQEHRTRLVDRIGAGYEVTVVQTLEERVLALSLDDVEKQGFEFVPTILAAFGFEEIPDPANRIGNRAIDPSTELGFMAFLG